MNPLKLLKSRFARNAATLQVAGLLNAVSNALSSIFLAHILGAHEQGRFVIALSLYSLLFFVVNLGVLQATVSQVAAAAARGLQEKVAQWLAFLLKTYVVLGVVIAVGGWWAIPAIGRLIGADPELARYARLLTLTPFLETPRVVAHAAFQGTRRMLYLAKCENGTELVRVFLVVIGALITRDYRGPILGTVATSLFGSLIAIDFYRRGCRGEGYQLPRLRVVLGHLREVPMRQGLGLGVRIGVLRQVDALSVQVLPPLILKWAMGPGGESWVAWFKIAQRIMTLPTSLMQGVSRTALPALSELAGMRDMGRFRRTFRNATLISGTLVAGGILLGLPVIHWLIEALYPADYLAPVWKLVLLLSVGAVIVSYAVAIDSFYIVTDRLRVAIVIVLTGMVTTVTLMIVLGRLYPPMGLVWGYLAMYCWGSVHYVYIYWYFRTHREFGPVVAPPDEDAAGPAPDST